MPFRYIRSTIWILLVMYTSTSIGLRPISSPGEIPLPAPSPFPPLTSAAIRACPVTFPNGRNPPSPIRVGAPTPHRHGNGILWTGWGLASKILPSPEYWHSDGSLDWKTGWFRGIHGHLEVVGHRLDAPAPPAIGKFDLPGYGTRGLQIGVIHFPSEGCWELIARLSGPQGQAQLRFVILLLRPPFPTFRFAWLPPGLNLQDIEVEDYPHALREVFRPPVEERERLWWGWEGGVWSREGNWENVPTFSWGYGKLVIETAQRSWSGGPSNPTGPSQRLTVRGQPGQCIQSPQEDTTALIWEEGAFRYRILQWGLKLSCADLLRIAEGPSTPGFGGKR